MTAMSAQDVKWIVIASVLLVSVSLWVGAHFPAPDQNKARMASMLGSARYASPARSLRAVVPATGDSWHSPAELARLKADAIRLDREEQDLAKPVPYDASHGFDAQHLAASSPQISGTNPSGPDPNAVGYDFNSQIRNASSENGSPSGGDASSSNQSASDQSSSDRYFNPYDPANYYPPGYTPSGDGSPSGGSDNDNLGNDDSSGSPGGSD